MLGLGIDNLLVSIYDSYPTLFVGGGTPGASAHAYNTGISRIANIRNDKIYYQY
jgi:hypothetical protein